MINETASKLLIAPEMCIFSYSNAFFNFNFYIVEINIFQGHEHIVVIDKSKFGKRKYNRGRRVIGKWILGGYCRTTGECFLLECTDKRRNHHGTHPAPPCQAARRSQDYYPTPRLQVVGYNTLRHHGYTHVSCHTPQSISRPLTGSTLIPVKSFHAKKHMLRGTASHEQTHQPSLLLSASLF